MKTIDFGAPFLTDNLCFLKCDEVAGEFDLQHASGCSWKYLDPLFSDRSYSLGCETCNHFLLEIYLSLEPFSGERRWRLVVSIREHPNLLMCNIAVEAVYLSATFTADDCNEPATLTLDSVNRTGLPAQACPGTFPDEVALL